MKRVIIYDLIDITRLPEKHELTRHDGRPVRFQVGWALCFDGTEGRPGWGLFQILPPSGSAFTVYLPGIGDDNKRFWDFSPQPVTAVQIACWITGRESPKSFYATHNGTPFKRPKRLIEAIERLIPGIAFQKGRDDEHGVWYRCTAMPD